MKEKENWHQRDGEQVLKEFNTDLDRGLSAAEVKRREKKYGPNALREEPARSLFSLFMGQMREVLVVILLVAATVSGILGEWADALVIMIIVIFNAVCWGCAGKKAEEACSLREMAKPWQGPAEVLSESRRRPYCRGSRFLMPGILSPPMPAFWIMFPAGGWAVLTGESLPRKDPATLGRGIGGGPENMLLWAPPSLGTGAGLSGNGPRYPAGPHCGYAGGGTPQALPCSSSWPAWARSWGGGVNSFLVFITGIWRGRRPLPL